jgi:hypothetical protein
VLALVIRFVPYRTRSGGWQLTGTIVLGVCIGISVAAAVYLIYVLEILKWRNTPVVKLVRERASSRGRGGSVA